MIYGGVSIFNDNHVPSQTDLEKGREKERQFFGMAETSKCIDIELQRTRIRRLQREY